MLGRRIAARQPPLTCLPELRRALLDEWCNIPQDQIDNLILSMPKRYRHIIQNSEWQFEGSKDNTRTYTARLVKNFLEAETMQRMKCPACFPNLNPIKHVWNPFKLRVEANSRPLTLSKTYTGVCQKGNNIPQSLIDYLSASMLNKLLATQNATP
ncbi:transposable element Tcb1 transposase [Trichonephila clavipes]|nr:transposable element Tcb1 transposase [Trichonephila clavipes]